MCKIPFEKVFATELFAINGSVSDDSGQITANMELFHFSQARHKSEIFWRRILISRYVTLFSEDSPTNVSHVFWYITYLVRENVGGRFMKVKRLITLLNPSIKMWIRKKIQSSTRLMKTKNQKISKTKKRQKLTLEILSTQTIKVWIRKLWFQSKKIGS